MSEFKGTREQPYSYCDMLNDIAKLEDTVPEKRITYSSIEKARSGKKCNWVSFKKMIFSIKHQEMYCMSVEMVDGIKTLRFSSFQMPVSEYTGPVSTIVKKQLRDYNTKPQSAGSYKHCEGGGWHSIANLYQLNGKIYTDAY